MQSLVAPVYMRALIKLGDVVENGFLNYEIGRVIQKLTCRALTLRILVSGNSSAFTNYNLQKAALSVPNVNDLIIISVTSNTITCENSSSFVEWIIAEE